MKNICLNNLEKKDTNLSKFIRIKSSSSLLKFGFFSKNVFKTFENISIFLKWFRNFFAILIKNVSRRLRNIFLPNNYEFPLRTFFKLLQTFLRSLFKVLNSGILKIFIDFNTFLSISIIFSQKYQFALKKLIFSRSIKVSSSKMFLFTFSRKLFWKKFLQMFVFTFHKGQEKLFIKALIKNFAASKFQTFSTNMKKEEDFLKSLFPPRLKSR